MYGRESSSDPPSSSTANAGRSSAPWSVRAEFTIHRGDDDEDNSLPVETTSRSASIAPTSESSGVRMTYSFTPRSPPRSVSPTTATGSYGFQRGNLVFTSTPPVRSSQLPVRSHTIPRSAQQPQQRYPGASGTTYSDSGYTSEQLSSRSRSSLASSDKRCRSTYSIVLSNARPYQQQQQLAYPRPWSSYYQSHRAQTATPCCRFSAVPEVCEDCAEAASGVRPFATHFCTKLADRTHQASSKDAASQTTDIEAKNSPVAQRRKLLRRKPTTAGALTTGSSGRDELKNNNFGRLSRTPASAKSPTPPASSEPAMSDSSGNAKDDNSEKRKRTVHIDVYCTGTDDDPNDDDAATSRTSSSDEEDDNATQTTVFEGTDVRVTHTQPKSGVLPRGFQDEKAFLKRATERKCESFKHAPMRMPSLASSKGYESDDVLSSLYPSQFSSYSRLKDFDSSVPWSAASSRSGIALDEYDSASATSWKDTVSDMESLVNSKASITPCDSFDYADSIDRERIRRLETTWSKKIGGAAKTPKGKNWRSPQVERKHLLQGKMMKDYMEKHPPVGWSSESSLGGGSSSEESNEEEVGWSFVSSEENASIVKGKLTLPAVSGGATVIQQTTTKTTTTSQVASGTTTDQETSQSEQIREVKTSIFRDRIGPFGSTSPSPTPSKLQSRVTSPFTTPQGERTDHIIKASIFGRVVSTFRKPGHHVGPAKNPACSCEHCRRYFEDVARGRSRSLDTVERRNGSRAPSVTN